MTKFRCLLIFGFSLLLLVGCTNVSNDAKAESFTPEVIVKDSISTKDSNPILETKVILSHREGSIQPSEKVIINPDIAKGLIEKKENQSKSVKGLFKTTLEAAIVNEGVKINFSLQNISGRNLEIVFGSGQQYDIFAYNDQDVEVYKWSTQYAFTQALMKMDIKKGGKLTYNEYWDFKDNDGNEVVEGVYKIKVVIVDLKIEGLEVSPEQLSAACELAIGDVHS
ncbi:BsuPI-related putative proteinase inhibitor [Cohnella sp. WQ 127256]|uniref:BsuPI-related putative proteinase inhibitor n=1 Tax=Cohnella sp. WQ 127256 TaxID=2938790 RepID=UPI0021180350|nr:BsuPI-related putative proteinase inhibitor [Cohnella sp. WQ 127256]